MSRNNSMITVDGVALISPSVFEWSINDVSTSDAGRTQDGLMHKNRITRKRKIVLKWNGPSPTEAQAILTAFSQEYFNVSYYDPLAGRRQTRTFYSGDQSAPVKVWTVGNKRYEQISFDIIER